VGRRELFSRAEIDTGVTLIICLHSVTGLRMKYLKFPICLHCTYLSTGVKMFKIKIKTMHLALFPFIPYVVPVKCIESINTTSILHD
jgi:hypothetical protein